MKKEFNFYFTTSSNLIHTFCFQFGITILSICKFYHVFHSVFRINIETDKSVIQDRKYSDYQYLVVVFFFFFFGGGGGGLARGLGGGGCLKHSVKTTRDE